MTMEATSVNRDQDLLEKSAALRDAIKKGNAREAFAAAELAAVVLDFRDSDAMIGLPPANEKRIDELRTLRLRALELSAKKGMPEAHARLARAALDDDDLAGAIEHYANAAASGVPELVVEAAELIRRADHRPMAKTAHGWLEKAGESDDGAVEYARALYAFHGFGRKKDHKAALALHEAAGKKGHGEAMFELYAMCSQGLGTKPDAKRALDWCVEAAEAGNARAMSNLGGFYATGNGVEQDTATSVTWYDRAAQAGHGKAAATLGFMYIMGTELAADPKKARAYFELADDAGFDWRPMAEQLGLEID